MKYEETVRKICGDDWRNTPYDERIGGLGVACVVAFLKGIKPNLEEMSRHLNVHPDDLDLPFSRLYRHGAFTHWNLKKDKALLGAASEVDAQIAWCHVAATASGFIGV